MTSTSQTIQRDLPRRVLTRNDHVTVEVEPFLIS